MWGCTFDTRELWISLVGDTYLFCLYNRNELKSLFYCRNYLSLDEQNQVINESLIFPDAVLKYSTIINEKERDNTYPPDSFPTLKISYGCKIFQDETGAQWRDEHSAPFCWKTSSQLFVNSPTIKCTPNKDAAKPTARKKPPVPPPKPPKSVIKLQDTSYQTKETQENLINKTNLGLDQFNHGSMQSLNCQEISANRDSLNSQVLPKTGCEFLDNW